MESLLIHFAQDTAQQVLDAVYVHLLPKLLEWIKLAELLHSSLLPTVLSTLHTTLTQFASCTVALWSPSTTRLDDVFPSLKILPDGILDAWTEQ